MKLVGCRGQLIFRGRLFRGNGKGRGQRSWRIDARRRAVNEMNWTVKRDEPNVQHATRTRRIVTEFTIEIPFSNTHERTFSFAWFSRLRDELSQPSSEGSVSRTWSFFFLWDTRSNNTVVLIFRLFKNRSRRYPWKILNRQDELQTRLTHGAWSSTYCRVNRDDNEVFEIVSSILRLIVHLAKFFLRLEKCTLLQRSFGNTCFKRNLLSHAFVKHLNHCINGTSFACVGNILFNMIRGSLGATL